MSCRSSVVCLLHLGLGGLRPVAATNKYATLGFCNNRTSNAEAITKVMAFGSGAFVSQVIDAAFDVTVG